jgi:CHAT domain-containing protein
LRAAALRDAASPDAHLAGVAALIAGDVDRSVAKLKEAAGAANDDPAVWSDFAAALLVQAGKQGTISPALDALAAADHASRISAGFAPAAFNRALALDLLGLLYEAREAWDEYRTLDASSGWAEEATAAGTRLEREITSERDWQADRVELEGAVARSDDVTIRKIVTAHPRDARAWGESAYTTAWAEATRKGDEDGARRQLNAARAIGNALLATSDERLLWDSVRSIDQCSSSPGNCAALAEAYLAYRSGRIDHSKHAATATPQLRKAAKLFARAGSPMQWVAMYYVGGALYAEQRLDEAAALLDELAARKFSDHGYLALTAQIGWERGLVTLARGSFSDALDIMDQSRRLFDELGDRTDSAVMRGFIATAYELAGDSERAWSIWRPVFEDLSGQQQTRSEVLILLSATSGMIARQEWDRALPLLDLTVKRLPAAKDVALACSALSQRSVVLAARGDQNGASRDLAELHAYLAGIGEPAVRAGFLVDARYAEALMLRGRDHNAAIAQLTLALDELGRASRSLFQSRIYLERARLQRSQGSDAAAREDVLAGLELTERNRRTLGDPAQRIMAALSAEELFAEGIELALEHDDVAEAFDLAERARARALLELFDAHTGGTAAAPMSLREVQLALAASAGIVEYALVHDEVVAFVITPCNAVAVRKSLRRKTADDLVAAAAAAVRRPGDRRALDDASDVLIGPVALPLAGVSHLAVVPDRHLSAVPFAALREPATGRLLLDRMTMIIAPSASLAIACSRRAVRQTGRSVLSIGATDFDRTRYPDVPALRTAGDEAREVGAAYGGGRVLEGPEATPPQVLAELSRANIVHFAGHSVAPPYDGSASALLLAPAGSQATLTAADIARFSLPALRLVVLSSCRSAIPGSAGDGVENLATAFLVAGAPSVIAASWDLDDQSAETLAVNIHRQYATDGDAASAFRDAVHSLGSGSRGEWAVVTPFGGSPSLVKQGEK